MDRGTTQVEVSGGRYSSVMPKPVAVVDAELGAGPDVVIHAHHLSPQSAEQAPIRKGWDR